MTERSIWNDINAIDVAGAAAAFRTSGETRYLCIDDFLRADFARDVAGAYPAFEEAVGQGKSYSALHESGKVQLTEASRFPAPVVRLHQVLSSDAFVQTLVEITSIGGLLGDPTLRGGGMHLMGPGGRLDVHVDFNAIREADLFRRLNLLVFLTPGWEDAWGGRFELWDPAVEERWAAFSPRFNRCVLFATGEKSFHGVEPVRCPRGESRRSFAAYYYTRDAPAGWSGDAHSTVFRHRPGERWRAILGIPADVRRAMWSAARRARDRFRTR